MDSFGSRADFTAWEEDSGTGTCTQKGPTLGLVLHCCCLEIINIFFQQGILDCRFALDPTNYAADPAGSF